MCTISLCMIVKNEEAVLARCLDSIKDLMDEIIIVDTGSSDSTKEIALRYTNKVYDFAWVDDFAAARNFSFSKATMDYIYAPDADEVIDEVNHNRFRLLKKALFDDIEIVQMKYITPAEYNTVANASSDMRPKLFKRLRTFTWINPVHETVRLDPVVYDSDIEIQHLPQDLHGKRDFTIFKKSIERDGSLAENITTMYAKELLKCGSPDDFADAAGFFEGIYALNPNIESTCVLARHYRLQGITDKFFSVALKNIATASCSEVCCELGFYYKNKENYDEALIWFYNAAFETKPVLDVETGGGIALRELSECSLALAKIKQAKLDALPINMQGNFASDKEEIELLLEQAKEYTKQAQEWMLPEE